MASQSERYAMLNTNTQRKSKSTEHNGNAAKTH